MLWISTAWYYYSYDVNILVTLYSSTRLHMGLHHCTFQRLCISVYQILYSLLTKVWNELILPRIYSYSLVDFSCVHEYIIHKIPYFIWHSYIRTTENISHTRTLCRYCTQCMCCVLNIKQKLRCLFVKYHYQLFLYIIFMEDVYCYDMNLCWSHILLETPTH